MVDFQHLDYREFEILVGLILQREGHSIRQGPLATGARGPDYETESPEGHPVVVDVKHFERSLTTRSELAQFAADIERYRQQKPDAIGLLVFSSVLNSEHVAGVTPQFPQIEIWDALKLKLLLEKHRDLKPLFHHLVTAKEVFKSQVQKLFSKDSVAIDLTARIRDLPCGRADWREFERIGTEILTYMSLRRIWLRLKFKVAVMMV